MYAIFIVFQSIIVLHYIIVILLPPYRIFFVNSSLKIRASKFMKKASYHLGSWFALNYLIESIDHNQREKKHVKQFL